MDKRELIQQEINNLSNVLGNKTDGTLAMMNKQMLKAVDYFIYNANGEFVKLCKGQRSVEQFCGIKPTQKSLKWVIKKEYLGEKIEVNVVRKKCDKPNNRLKIVLQYTLEGEFVKEWSSSVDAAKSLGLKTQSSITNCCLGKIKTAGGFIWKYKD